MASSRKIRDEVMLMTISVNSDPAQQAIHELKNNTKELTAANVELSKELKDVVKARVAEEKAVNSYADKIDKAKEKMRALQTTAMEQKKSLTNLRAEYQEGSAEYQRYTNKIEALKAKSKADTENSIRSTALLINKQKELAAELAKTKLKEADLTNTIASNNNQIELNRERIAEHTKGLNIETMTVRQLEARLKDLKTAYDHAIPNTDSAKKIAEDMQAVSSRLAIVKQEAKQTSLSFSNLAERFNHYSGIVTAVVAVLVGFGISIQNIIDRNNKMADAMSGVEKNVNMTKKEVEDLTRSFSDLDTRTSKMDLLAIATGGGRLGVAKEDIREFVEVTDKAIVALGDSWNQAPDKISESLGKVTTLYKETRDLPIAESINGVGSALNELAADGAASEQNINDFATRVGALPEKLKPAIGDALGLGAAFEESGIDAERSGTAYTNFVKIAANNVERFAYIMRLPVEQVKQMINTDPTEFFLRFSEGLKGMDATVLAETLDYLKINDQYITSIVGAASEKTERFRDTLELSNQSLKEGTSLLKEADKVNNNAAGTFEKLQNKIAGIFTSKSLSNFLDETIYLFGRFIGVIKDSNGYITVFRSSFLFLVKIFAVATAATISMNLVTGVYNKLLVTAKDRVLGLTIVEKARNVVTALGNALNTLYTAGLGLLGAGYALVTRNTAQAAFAMRGFTAAIAANPVGAIVTLVTAAAAAFFLFKDSVEETNEALAENAKETNYLATANKKAIEEQAKSIGELKSKTEPLLRIIKDVNSGLDARKKAYQELIKIAPEFEGTLDSEFRATSKLDSAYSSLIEKIKKAAEIRSYQASLDELYTKRTKIAGYAEINNQLKDNQTPSKEVTINGQKVELKNSTVDPKNEAKLKFINDLSNKTNAELQDLDLSIDKVTDKIAKLQASETTSTYAKPPSDANKNSNKNSPKNNNANDELEAFKKLKQEMLKEGEKLNDDLLQQDSDLRDAQIALMEEGVTKELAILEQDLYKERLALNKKMYSPEEYKNIDTIIARVGNSEKAIFESIKQNMLDSDAKYNQLEIEAMNRFEQKKKTIIEKAGIDELKNIDNNYQTRLGQLNRQRDEEIAQYTTVEEMKAALQNRISKQELDGIKTWQDGKKALTKIYQKQELELHIAHMQAMIQLYEGMDLSILNKEQQEQILKFLEEAKNKVAELNAAKTGADQPEEETGKGKSRRNSGTDILGMSVDDWQNLFDNLEKGAVSLENVKDVIGAVQSAFSTYYAYVQANEQAQITQVERAASRKEKRLKKMLDNGMINQEQYDEELERLNKETEMKKWRLEYDAAKKQRNFQIGQTIANTAQAIMNIWATAKNPITAAALTVMAGALGAFQVSTIAKQPLPEAPGYEDGFGMNYDIRRQQDGKKFRVSRQPLTSGLVKKPTHFIAGENNRLEMVIDESTYKGFSPRLKTALSQEIGSSRGFEGGYYPYLSDNNSQPVTNNGDYATVINNNTMALKRVAEMKPRAYIVKDMDLAKDIIDVTDEYNSYKNSARK